MNFNRSELEILKMIKETKYNYSLRFTPKVRKSENWESKIWGKLSQKLKNKGYEVDGWLVRDIGNSSYRYHYHSLMRVKGLIQDKSFSSEIESERFKNIIKEISGRHDLDVWVEDYNNNLGGYEEYCVSKIKNTPYWVESWII
tara:strand:- start:146 stop:574 length:429 start_codon:yes stop_codon:yes gene_type:complete